MAKRQIVERKTLRIAMISFHSSPLGEIGTRDTGGMSIYIRQLAGGLAALGHSVDIFTRRQHQDQASFVELSHRVRIVHLDAGGWEPLPPPALSSHLREFTSGLSRMRSREGLSYDLVHSHYWLSGLVGRSVALSWRIPHVIVFHTLGMLKNLAFREPVEPEIRIGAERELCAESERVIATTEAEKEALAELYDAPADRVAVIPCGVDLMGFRPLARGRARQFLGLPVEDPVVLYVGRFDPVKGLDDLLRAMALVRSDRRPVQLMVVGGDGDSAAEARTVHELAERLHVGDRVTFAGRIPHEDLPVYYSAADLLAIPSHYESFGLVALEALACGTPIVATPVGAMKALLADGRGGLLVEARNPKGLADGIHRVLAGRASGRRTIESVRAAAKPFDWRFIAGSVESEYLALVPGKNAGTSTVADLCAASRRKPAPRSCCGSSGFSPADSSSRDRRPRWVASGAHLKKEGHDYGAESGCLGGGSSSG